MTITNTKGFTTIKADDDKFLWKDGTAPFKIAALGINDSPENYTEITAEEAEQIIKESEETQND